MSYNISTVNVKEINLQTTGERLRELYLKYKNNLPEGNLFENIDLLKLKDNEKVNITSLQWYGTWSGNSFDAFKDIVTSFTGTAKFSIVWEDGEVIYCVLKNNELEYVEVNW